ncbi:hypothetical protein CLAIMM_08348 isoform 2 [Cladophialophora immunda]|nr:hypothetical protein CLAIMM_08348 isoform 1 [Cladophialophora immunda]OQV03296.1 hypothetical protein CLAIMM_08348 isoform 2 [Cladophialophora immunda]
MDGVRSDGAIEGVMPPKAHFSEKRHCATHWPAARAHAPSIKPVGLSRWEYGWRPWLCVEARDLLDGRQQASCRCCLSTRSISSTDSTVMMSYSQAIQGSL